MDTLNDNVDNAKSCQWKRLILQFAAKKNFLAADRRDIYIINGDKNLIAFISLLLIQKKCIQKIIFWRRFVWESFQCKYRVTHQWTNSVNKNYESLWFILLQVTKGFTFQKNKNVRFISSNFSSERLSCKVKTIRCGLYILINKHLRYRCLEFTILKHTWPIFAKTIIAFLLEFRIKTFCLRSSEMIMKQNLDK